MNSKYFSDCLNPENEDIEMSMHQKLDRLKKNTKQDNSCVFSDLIYTMLAHENVHVSKTPVFQCDGTTVTADALNVYEIRWMLLEGKSVVVYDVHYSTEQDTLRGIIF